jgi:ABC-type enterochelin transport system permease subunit
VHDANASKIWNGLLILAAVAVASFVTVGILLMTGVFNPNTVSIEALTPDGAQTKSPAEGRG